jgi:hypothetical protein
MDQRIYVVCDIRYLQSGASVDRQTYVANLVMFSDLIPI